MEQLLFSQGLDIMWHHGPTKKCTLGIVVVFCAVPSTGQLAKFRANHANTANMFGSHVRVGKSGKMPGSALPNHCLLDSTLGFGHGKKQLVNGQGSKAHPSPFDLSFGYLGKLSWLLVEALTPSLSGPLLAKRSVTIK